LGVPFFKEPQGSFLVPKHTFAKF